MIKAWWLLPAAMFGACLGFFLCALMTVAKEADNAIDEFTDDNHRSKDSNNG